VRQRYSCFGIAEYPYFDLDVWEGFTSFYSSSFRQFKRACRRIHFFDGAEAVASQVLRYLRNGESLRKIESLGVQYKGFTIVRPLSSFVVGRTAIKFDERGPQEIGHVDKHALESTGTPFCKGEFEQCANVYATRLTICAAPFIQQDPVIGVCASAALWSASQVLANRYGLHKFPYTTITHQALYSRLLPSFPMRKDAALSPGLNIQHISDALAHTGATPLTVYPGEGRGNAQSLQARFRFLTYTFVESGMPAILCFQSEAGYHAVTLLGHLLPGAQDQSDIAETQAELTCGASIAMSGRHHLIGQGVQLYYAHDDAYGPFNRIHILNDAVARDRSNQLPDNHFLKNSACLIALGRTGADLARAYALIVGLPRYVQNSPEGVMVHAIRELESWLRRIEGTSQQFSLLWRCLLVETSRFKSSLHLRDSRLPYMIRRKYDSLHLPRFVWLVEFTVIPSGNLEDMGKRRHVDGEFLYDSTTPIWEPWCITQRVGNCFRDLRETRVFQTLGKDSTPRPCFISV
jgi:hypothetical protein